jgi:NAD(P)-dependent dehydrogenase (short-subunit alcohol dehydrogenase family)
MLGRVCVVTGASRGIGKATARQLAKLGATVGMICRDPARGAEAVAEVLAATGNAGVHLLVADLASFESIRTVARDIARRWPALHVLVNNAGVSRAHRTVTVDGFETTIAVNHLAPFLLTHELLPLLRAGEPSRIVTVTSVFERGGRISFDDLQSARRYNGTRAYLQSKLANVLFSHALAERLRGTGVTSSCVFPGLVATDLLREYWWWKATWLQPVWRKLFDTADEAGRAVVYAACAQGGTGECYAGSRLARSSGRSYDKELQERLWAISEELTGARGW